MDYRSIHRRQAWLGIGFAGYSVLANPARAAWPLFETNTRASLPGTAAGARRGRHHLHERSRGEQPSHDSLGAQHGTPLGAGGGGGGRRTNIARFLRGESSGASTSSPTQLVGRAASRDDGPASAVAPPDDGELKEREGPKGRSRRSAKEVEIVLHGVFGDWGPCQPETCTQTRQVLCETRESRIVANDLCGDELPAAVRACEGADAAATCGAALGVEGDGTEVDGKAVTGGGGGGGESSGDHSKIPSFSGGWEPTTKTVNHGSIDGGSSHDPKGPAGDGAASEKKADVPEEKSGGSSPPAVKHTAYNPPGSRGTPVSGPRATPDKADQKNASSSRPGQQGVDVSAPAATKTTGSEGSTVKEEEKRETNAKVEGSNAANSSEKPSERGVGPDVGHGKPGQTGEISPKEGASEEEEEQVAGPSDPETERYPSNRAGPTSPSSKESPSQGQGKSSGKPPNFAQSHTEQVIDKLSGGTKSGLGRAEYRFWVVLAIGAGAVGSFLAVVVFAVGQYRKEQHRLRGIMALNEFPQDNYINPFARRLSSDASDDDRLSFKL